MASREKAELKAAMADEVMADFDQLMDAGEKKKYGAKAVRVKLDALMMWLHSYRQRIDKALDDGVIKADARDDVLQVFTDIASYINKEHRLSLREDAAADPFLAGIARARLVVLARRDAELARADESDEIEAEDDAWERGDDPQDEQDAPITDEVSDLRDALVDAMGGVWECGHCGDETSTPVHCGNKGEPAIDACPPCAEHLGRYGKLPSAKALAKRRSTE